MKKFFCAAAALMFAAGFAAGAGTPPAGTSASGEAGTNAKPSQDRVVCEHQEELGSRLRSNRVCMKASEWAERRRQERADLQRMQTGGQCAHSGKGC